jgi:hypothetical protein
MSMRYRIKSLVVGVLDLPYNGLTMSYGQTFETNQLNEELLIAKGNRHVEITELYDSKTLAQSHDMHDEERRKKKREES